MRCYGNDHSFIHYPNNDGCGSFGSTKNGIRPGNYKTLGRRLTKKIRRHADRLDLCREVARVEIEAV